MVQVRAAGILMETDPQGRVLLSGSWPPRAEFGLSLLDQGLPYIAYRRGTDRKLIDVKLANARAVYRVDKRTPESVEAELVYTEKMTDGLVSS